MAGTIPLPQEPQFVAALPTPTYGPGGSTSLTYATTIAASPATCAELLLALPAYPSWNRFVQRATILATPEEPTSPALPPSLAHLASRPGCLSKLGTRFQFEVHSTYILYYILMVPRG